MTVVVSVADARAQFSRLVESASVTHERFEVTRNGNRVAVVLGADDFDALMETVDVLSRADEVPALHAGIAELADGDVSSEAEVAEAMRAAGRIRR